MKSFKQKLKGYSLVEIVLAIGIFAVISSMLVLLVVDSTRTLESTQTRAKATHLTQEIYSALLLLKSESWYNVARYTNEGSKHISYTSGRYEILDGEEVRNNLAYSFSVLSVLRDSSGNIVDTGGSLDPHSRLISINISWIDKLNQTHTINPKIYINDWNTNSITYTTSTDFDRGSYTQTMSQILNGGEVRLQSMKYADWCNPSLSLSSFDLPQQGIATTISTSGDTIYMGTGENASGISFMKATTSGEPPQVTVGSTFNGYKTNDVFGLNGNALLATDTNSEEVVIIDITSVPYTKVGYFDSVGQQDATSVFALSGKGFVTHGNNLTIFDLSSVNGARPQLSTTPVGTSSSIVTDMYVDNDYIYLTVTNNTHEFLIYEYNSGLKLIGQGDLGTQSSTSLFISEDKTRAYIGTATNIGKEFFILDISTKTGSYPIVMSYELGLLSVKSVIAVDNRAIIGGYGGEEYVVLDIENETVIAQCGGLQIDTGINAIALVRQGVNLYSYILTKDATQELKIIRGGPGGGGPDGDGYFSEGLYISDIFDSTSIISTYYILGLTTSVPTGTSLQIQLRVSNDPSMTGSTWIGPDGTSNTYYQETGVYNLPTSLTGRYIQYKAAFGSDTVLTPLLEELVINYEK
ncbi:hypothetical protein A2436_01795 [candidate division WS6 bacterium RIFOXYC1_FULL_33_9]|nr:MAG: hypothetical protein UR49_C0002G0038 [candidate division WS6 bacterium GW2011_GWF2_33_92]OGC35848.1 MAG: hypothetical protein A2369_02035 [candidate division WS6 bacterium RIFOXYB1_FULL_33_15]OGC37506.1 MAG: hypothetical protein A2436_01795 [candidate division WS6 bacterium RIFOXYC1_FULL_33_9]